MHLVMHPEDTAMVVGAGWAERHPLCRTAKKWWVMWPCACNKRVPVPESLVLVYVPLMPEHQDVVMACVKAAASSCASVPIEKLDEGYIPLPSTPSTASTMLMTGSPRVEL